MEWESDASLPALVSAAGTGLRGVKALHMRASGRCGERKVWISRCGSSEQFHSSFVLLVWTRSVDKDLLILGGDSEDHHLALGGGADFYQGEGEGGGPGEGEEVSGGQPPLEGAG